MAKKRSEPRKTAVPTSFEQARDELFSHILRCGVLEASGIAAPSWPAVLLSARTRSPDATETPSTRRQDLLASFFF
jgi:hypothetical protein